MKNGTPPAENPLHPDPAPSLGDTRGTSLYQLAKLTCNVTSILTKDKMVTMGNYPPYTWWLTFAFDSCQVAVGLDSWDMPPADGTKLNGLSVLLNTSRAIRGLGDWVLG